MKEILTPGTDLPRAAARLLAVRKPAGAVAVLLAYLPEAGEEALEEEVVAALVRLGVRGGKIDPALAAAARDRLPVRRLAAAEALARAAGEGHRAAARELLQDPDPRVRLWAARALLSAREKSAVPALTALLEEARSALAGQAEDLLYRLAGEGAPTAPPDAGSPAGRRKRRAAWEAWWKAKGDKIDLAQFSRGEQPLGLTVTCECGAGGAENAGLVRACGAGGKLRWEVGKIGNTTGAELLPGGRVLIAQYRDQKVVERDRHGKVLWEYALDQHPISAQRLPNGNTLIGTLNGKLLEVTRAGKTVFQHNGKSMIFGARKMRNGHIFYLDASHVVELGADGKPLRRIPAAGAASWGGLEVLPGDRFLVAQYGGGKVVELDGAGRVVWQCTAQSPASATRLRNGHTLVAEAETRRLVEFDRAGKEVSRQTTPGRPFYVRRY